jgi:hypothetical protein
MGNAFIAGAHAMQAEAPLSEHASGHEAEEERERKDKGKYSSQWFA